MVNVEVQYELTPEAKELFPNDAELTCYVSSKVNSGDNFSRVKWYNASGVFVKEEDVMDYLLIPMDNG